MAKGQKRSNREVKKPKADKTKIPGDCRARAEHARQDEARCSDSG